MHRRQSIRFQCIFLFLTFQCLQPVQASENVTCYFPNGHEIAEPSSTTDFYSACSSSAGNDSFHMCCKTGYPFNDVCDVNGLCARQSDPSLSEDQGLLRSTCTDPSWSSPSCLQLCITGLDYLGNVANATEQYVKKCNDGSWCCEAQTPPLNNLNSLNSTLQTQVDTCCDQGKGVFIENGIVTDVNPNATATGSVGTANGSVAPASTASAHPKHGVNAGAIAGGVVGGIAGLVIIVAAVFLLLRSRKMSRAQKKSTTSVPTTDDGLSRGIEGIREVQEKYGNEQQMNGTGEPYAKYGTERFEKDGGEVRDGPHEIQ